MSLKESRKYLIPGVSPQAPFHLEGAPRAIVAKRASSVYNYLPFEIQLSFFIEAVVFSLGASCSLCRGAP